MFTTWQNAVDIGFTLLPDGPILVRSQSVGLDPSIAEMTFQRTHRNGKATVFLAGSGLKGVVRAHGERILRSRGTIACDPTRRGSKERPKSPGQADLTPGRCGDSPLGLQERGFPHANQCAACFTFGSLKLAGRFRLSDAYPVDELWEETNRTEVRTLVGIDRKSQAAARGGALFDAEVVVDGGFRVRLTGENYSLWQVGLVLAALRDLGEGFVQVGGAKSRGMGTVRLKDWSVDFRFTGSKAGTAGTLAGARAKGREDEKYSLIPEDEIAIPEGGRAESKGLFRTVHYQADKLDDLEPLSAALTQRLENYFERVR